MKNWFKLLAFMMLFGFALVSCTKEVFMDDLDEKAQEEGIELRLEGTGDDVDSDDSDEGSSADDADGDGITDDDDEDDDDELEDEKKGE